ncbi:MAG: cephalosporin hydroxylase family protein [Pseudomonadota bacterium]
MDPNEKFAAERRQRIGEFARDDAFQTLSRDWLEASMGRKYIYNFDWLGRPIIQYTQDMFAVQELIWRVKPDLVIETGIAHGGSLILSASLLALLDYCDAVEMGTVLDPRQPSRRVIGVDIDIRAHNRAAIEAHPLAGKISLVEGSSVSEAVISEVRKQAKPFRNVMVFLDSMHTHDHVLAELEAYSPLVTLGSYCVVFDTFVEDMPRGFFADRPWDVGNNPKTAVRQFLKTHTEFEIDTDMENKLLVTAVPSGFLRRTA